MGKGLIYGLVLVLMSVFFACSDEDNETCSYDVEINVDLSSIDDSVGCTDCMGESGDDFYLELMDASIIISNNTCPALEDTTGADLVDVLRNGSNLTVYTSSDALNFDLTDDSIRTSDFSIDNDTCENEFSNISGSLDYTVKGLDLSYQITVIDVDECEAFE